MSGFYSWYGSDVLGRLPLTLDDRIRAMQFTPDGKALLTETDKIDQIEWPSKNRRILWRPHSGETMCHATFSPDGTLFANSENGDKVHLHECATGRLLYTFQGRFPRLTATAWSSNSGRLAIGVGHEAVIYNVKTGTEVQKLAFGNSDITALGWSPNDKWIVAQTELVGVGKSVHLRSFHDDSVSILLPGNSDTDFSYSPDSMILAVSSLITTTYGQAKIFYLWDLETAKEMLYYGTHGYNCIAHSPDGRFLVGCGLDKVEILDAMTGREVCRRNTASMNCSVLSAAFSPDGKILATGNGDQVCFRDTTTWNEIDPDDVLCSSVSALAFSDDGRHLVTGGLNGDLVLWDWEEKEAVWKYFHPARGWLIQGLSIDPTGRWIGVVQPPYEYESHRIRLVDFATGKTARWVNVPKLKDVAPLFHPSRRTAYIATWDHEIVEWDCESGEVLQRLPLNFLIASKASKIAGIGISALRFDQVTPEIIWWNAKNQAFGRIDVRNGVESCTYETGFIPPDLDPIPPRDHEFVAIGSFVWNIPTLHGATQGEHLHDTPTVRHPSELLQFSASDYSVRVFDILSQSFIQSFHFGPGRIKAIALSPDGRTLIAASSGGVHYFSFVDLPGTERPSLEALWRLMGREIQWQAYEAAWTFGRHTDYLGFIENNLSPARELGAEELARVKTLLDDSDHEVRQSAARLWLDLGQELDRETLENLREGALSNKWPRRFTSRSVRLGPIPLLAPLSAHRRAMMAVMLLKADRSEESRRILKKLADGSPIAPLTKAAVKALTSRR